MPMQTFVTISTFILVLMKSAVPYSTYEVVQEGWPSVRTYYEGQAGLSQFPPEGQLRTFVVESVEPPPSFDLSQHTNVQAAAGDAKINFIQEAENVAANARATLARKELANSFLRSEVEKAYASLEEETKQYQLAEQISNTAKEAANAAKEQVKSLTETVQQSKSTAEQARTAIDKAEAGLESQILMVKEAHQSYRDFSSKQRAALEDLEATREAAERASAAAKEAIENVSYARSYSSEGSGDESRWRSESEPQAANIYYHPY